MTKYDFDRVVDREGTFAAKYDERVKNFGTDQVIPLWIADMDFPTAPPPILRPSATGRSGATAGRSIPPAAPTLWV